MPPSTASPRNTSSEVFLISSLALMLGGLLVYSMQSMETKWLAAILIVMFFFGAAVLTGRIERFLFRTLFFIIPINADFPLFPEITEWKGVALPIGTPQFALSAMDIILLLLYFIWIGRILADKKRSTQAIWPAGATLFLCLIAWAALSLMNAQSLELGLFLWFNYIKMFLLFFYVANHVKTREDYLMAAQSMMAGMVVEALITFGQHLVGGNLGLGALGEGKKEKEVEMLSGIRFRPGGTLGHPNSLGGYFGTVLPIALALHLAPGDRGFGYFWRILAISMGALALIITLSRSAWLTTILAVIGLAVWAASRTNQKIRWKPLLGLLAFGLVAGAIFSPVIVARWQEDDKGSTYSRVPQTQMGLGMVRARPFLGVGLNNYAVAGYLYETYVVDPKTRGRVYQHNSRIHNVFLQLASEIGLPGLGLFLLFLFRVIWIGWMRLRRCSDELVQWILVGLIWGLISRIFHDAVHTGDIALLTQIWIYSGMISAAVWIPRKTTRKASPSLR